MINEYIKITIMYMNIMYYYSRLSNRVEYIV